MESSLITTKPIRFCFCGCRFDLCNRFNQHLRKHKLKSPDTFHQHYLHLTNTESKVCQNISCKRILGPNRNYCVSCKSPITLFHANLSLDQVKDPTLIKIKRQKSKFPFLKEFFGPLTNTVRSKLRYKHKIDPKELKNTIVLIEKMSFNGKMLAFDQQCPGILGIEDIKKVKKEFYETKNELEGNHRQNIEPIDQDGIRTEQKRVRILHSSKIERKQIQSVKDEELEPVEIVNIEDFLASEGDSEEEYNTQKKKARKDSEISQKYGELGKKKIKTEAISEEKEVEKGEGERGRMKKIVWKKEERRRIIQVDYID